MPLTRSSGNRAENDLERGLLAASATANGNNNHARTSNVDPRRDMPAPSPATLLAASSIHSMDAFYAEGSTTPGALLRRGSSIHRDRLDETIPIEVKLDHVDYFVENGKKQIIHDVSLNFQPGRLACMMGPSGSGKTTCLNLILGNAAGVVKNGRVLVNDEPGPPRDFKSVAKLIPQEDVILPSFSVKETLSYHAQLVLPQKTTPEEREARIEAVMKSLGLMECADTRVGSVDLRGISGGQRKRCSIAMELLSNPCVLLVDEPTSGLDSSSAEVVVQILKDLSHIAGKRTVITTIHQPSYRIFSLFDDVTLLTKGRVAYSGPMKDLEAFFSSLGHDVPLKENPADHYMRLLQDQELAYAIPAEFKKSQHTLTSIPIYDPTAFDTRAAASNRSLKGIPRYPTSTLHQVQVLFRRQSMDYLKDPHKFMRMIGMKSKQSGIDWYSPILTLTPNETVGVGVMVGTVWFHKADPPRQSELFAIQGALFILVFNGIIDTLAMTILTFPLVRSLLLREYKNGSYSVLSFYIATMLSMGMFGALFVICMAFPVYVMVGFEFTAQKFGIFLSATAITTLIGNALGVTVGAASKDIISAQNMLVPIIAPLMLFSGYAIPKNQIPQWAMPFYYASFFQYAIALYEINCFTGMVFADYNIDLRHPTKIRPLKTGEQFLQAMGLDPDTHHPRDYLLILAGYAAGFTFLGYFVVKRAVAQKNA